MWFSAPDNNEIVKMTTPFFLASQNMIHQVLRNKDAKCQQEIALRQPTHSVADLGLLPYCKLSVPKCSKRQYLVQSILFQHLPLKPIHLKCLFFLLTFWNLYVPRLASIFYNFDSFILSSAVWPSIYSLQHLSLKFFIFISFHLPFSTFTSASCAMLLSHTL